MAKIAAALVKGDLLPPNPNLGPGSNNKWQRVAFVDFFEDSSDVTVTTEEFESYTFRANEVPAFPRHDDGQARIFYNRVIGIQELAVGDIIPNLNPAEPFENGYLVKGIQITAKGWLVYLQEMTTQESVRLLVGSLGTQDIFAACSILDANGNEKPQPKTSGWYLDTFTDKKVRFRLARVVGRPPKQSLEAPPVDATAAWAKYDLIPGQNPHPDDPRYSVAE